MTDKKTGKPKGFAFVEFDRYDHMETCLKKYQHSVFADGKKGRKINVELTYGISFFPSISDNANTFTERVVAATPTHERLKSNRRTKSCTTSVSATERSAKNSKLNSRSAKLRRRYGRRKARKGRTLLLLLLEMNPQRRMVASTQLDSQ